MNFLKTVDGKQELDFEVIASATSASFAEKMKEVLRDRTRVFKITTNEQSSAAVGGYLEFRMIVGIRRPSFYFKMTYAKESGVFWIDHDIGLYDVDEVINFINQYKKDVAADQGDHINSLNTSTSILPSEAIQGNSDQSGGGGQHWHGWRVIKD